MADCMLAEHIYVKGVLTFELHVAGPWRKPHMDQNGVEKVEMHQNRTLIWEATRVCLLKLECMLLLQESAEWQLFGFSLQIQHMGTRRKHPWPQAPRRVSTQVRVTAMWTSDSSGVEAPAVRHLHFNHDLIWAWEEGRSSNSITLIPLPPLLSPSLPIFRSTVSLGKRLRDVEAWILKPDWKYWIGAELHDKCVHGLSTNNCLFTWRRRLDLLCLDSGCTMKQNGFLCWRGRTYIVKSIVYVKRPTQAACL